MRLWEIVASVLEYFSFFRSLKVLRWVFSVNQGNRREVQGNFHGEAVLGSLTFLAAKR